MAPTWTTSSRAWLLRSSCLPDGRSLVAAFAAALTLGCTMADNGGTTAPSPVASATATVASVAGTWTGTDRVVECVQHDGGPLANMCTALGVDFPFTLELSQNGEVVSGRAALANVWFDLTPGAIVNDRVTLKGAGRIDNAGVQVDVTWSLSIARPALGGTAIMEWAADAGGGATLRATIVGRVSG